MTSWNAGCATPAVGDICGTASDSSGVSGVTVSIKRNSDNLYWDGAAFTSVPEVKNNATGTTSWSYPLPASALTDGVSYTITSRGTDNAGNEEASSVVTFTSDTTPPPLPTFIATDPTSPANNNNPKIIGSAEAGSTVKIYDDAACTPPEEASGGAAAFASPGIAVSVADNTSTTFYATATDAASNTSGCSTSSITYEEVTPAGGPTPVGGISFFSGSLGDRSSFGADGSGSGLPYGALGAALAAGALAIAAGAWYARRRWLR